LEVFVDLLDDVLTGGIMISDQRHEMMMRYYPMLGITKLRTSIAHCIGRRANIQPGDVVLDPCCGSGTIPIECAMCWKGAVYCGGDIDPESVKRSYTNAKHCGVNFDIFLWSARRLPFRANTIDKVITDLPFGNKSGSHKTNQKLYSWLFKEMNRILKVGGFALMLTVEKKVMNGLLKINKNWNLIEEFIIDMDGMLATLYILQKLQTR